MASNQGSGMGRVRVVGSQKEADVETMTVGGNALPTARTTRAQLERAGAAGAHAFESLDSDDSDDACYMCGMGGEVLVCDEKGCGKVYHTICLGSEPSSDERFTCPQHYCCVCGLPDRSVSHKSDTDLTRCTSCPSAFCPAHRPDSSHFNKLAAYTRPVTIPPNFFQSVFIPASVAEHTAQQAALVGGVEEEVVSSGAKRARLVNDNGEDLTVTTTARVDVETKTSDANTPLPTVDSIVSPLPSDATSGKKRRRPNELQKILASDTPPPKTPLPETSRSRIGPTTSVYRCNSCLYPTAHQRLAKLLEQVVVSVATSKQVHQAKALTPLLAEQAAVPVYIACGHSHSSLQLEVSEVVEACRLPASSEGAATAGRLEKAGAPAPRPRNSAQRKELLKFAGKFAPAQIAAAFLTSQEVCLVPAVPCCLSDILAGIRTCKYSSLDELRNDLHRGVKSVARLVGYPGAAALAEEPDIAYTDELERAYKLKDRIGGSDGDRAPRSSPLAEDNSGLEGESHIYATAYASMVRQVERALLSKKFKDKLHEAERDCGKAASAAATAVGILTTCKLKSGEPYRTDAWVGAADDEPVWLHAMLDADLRIPDTDALAKLYATRLSALHPELSWSWIPYRLKQLSLAVACDHINNFPVSRKAGATQVLEQVLQRALQDRRKPILSGFGGSSLRWKDADILAAPTEDVQLEQKLTKQMSSSSSKESRESESDTDTETSTGGSTSESDDSSDEESLKEKLEDMPLARKAPAAGFDRTFARWALRSLRAKAKAEKAGSEENGLVTTKDADVDAFNEKLKLVSEWARQVIPAEERSKKKNDREQNVGTPQTGLSSVETTGASSVPSLMGLAGGATATAMPGTPLGLLNVAASHLGQGQLPLYTGPEHEPSWTKTIRSLQSQLLAHVDGATESATTQVTSISTIAGIDASLADSVGSKATVSDGLSTDKFELGAVPESTRPVLKMLSALSASPSTDTLTALLAHTVAEQHLQQQKSEAQAAVLVSSMSALMTMMVQQQALIEQTRQTIASIPASRAAAARVVAASSPGTLTDGPFNSYSALASEAPPTASAVRANYLAMQPKERQAVSMLSEMAPMDVDADCSNLSVFLPPSEAEVVHLLDDMSSHLRKSLLTHAELRSAWAASRRAMLSFAAPVGVERKLLVPGDNADGDESEWVACDPSLEEDGPGSSVITLGEGRAAAELMVANRCLADRCKRLEALLVAKGVGADVDAE